MLVSIFMEGGWDALSVLAPVKEAKYKELRPVLGLAEGSGRTFTEDENLMWHPSATGLAELHEEGKVTAFPAIGYEPQDESHFTSRHYWEVGQLDTNTRTGWMGRYLDIAGEPTNPLQGLSLDYSLAPALATETMPVAAVSSPADYTMWAEGLGSPVIEPALETFGALGALAAPSPAYAQARAASYDTDLVLNKMASFVKSEKESGDKSAVTYPSGEFAERLAVLAAMLHTEMPIKCASLNAVGSYDTHSDEAGTLATNLAQTVAAVVAFQRDLEARGLDQRVLIQLWSEFGRRPRENGSGTDHGAGGNAFLIGTRAVGQDGRRVPRPDQTGRKRKRPADLGLPRDVLLAAGTVVPDRSRPGDPRSGVVRTARVGQELTCPGASRSLLLLGVLCLVSCAAATIAIAAPGHRSADAAHTCRHVKHRHCRQASHRKAAPSQTQTGSPQALAAQEPRRRPRP